MKVFQPSEVHKCRRDRIEPVVTEVHQFLSENRTMKYLNSNIEDKRKVDKHYQGSLNATENIVVELHDPVVG